MFFGNVVKIRPEGKTGFLPDGNQIYKVTFNGLH
jgi:hypothetical protein